jgi:cell wall-associated NlpC family hydrolase
MRSSVIVVASIGLLTACAPAQNEMPGGSTVPVAQSRANAAVAFADAQVGKSYCWGGMGPSCFDCSGLVREAWGAAGVNVPHSSSAIASELTEVPGDEARPGDVLWWPGHVAIYAGGGWAIEALDSRSGVVRRRAKPGRRVYRPGG